MKEKIQEQLQNLEKQQDIKILYAVESGSRAWGFASTNSDWDVRFIYIHRRDWYLSIDSKRDNIEMMLPDDLDLSGWEMRKALKLFRKSNPPLLEWLNSPIVYREDEATMRQFRALAAQVFNPKSCLYHYLSMAKSTFKEYLERDTVRLKKYFYVLRPVLACSWIEKMGSMAPTEFQKLYDSQVANPEIRSIVDKLLVEKMSGEELGQAAKIEKLNQFLEEKIEYFTVFLQNFEVPKRNDTEVLDEFFRSTLTKFDKN